LALGDGLASESPMSQVPIPLALGRAASGPGILWCASSRWWRRLEPHNAIADHGLGFVLLDTIGKRKRYFAELKKFGVSMVKWVALRFNVAYQIAWRLAF
jgi:hypothetical protein